VARAAVLIRLGRRAEAVEACRSVLEAVRSANMTAQVWTMIRLIAELLAGLGDRETAAVLVAAADADPLAPVVMGPDRERLAALRTVTAAATTTTAATPLPPVRDMAATVDLALRRLARQP
jgi:hypothetical protein